MLPTWLEHKSRWFWIELIFENGKIPCPLFGKNSKESGLSKAERSFLRNVITWSKYKGARERMSKNLWADSGEPQIRGSQAETGIPREHGKEQSLKSFFLVWRPWHLTQPLFPSYHSLEGNPSWLHPALPHGKRSVTSQWLLPSQATLSVSLSTNVA